MSREARQVDQVLEQLRGAGAAGVCAAHFYATGIPNARNRVGELRARGHHIESTTCVDDHRANYARYSYRHGPERVCGECLKQRQLELAIA